MPYNNQIPRGSSNAAEQQVRIFQVAGTPVNGVSGTFAGVAGPGSFLIDTTNLQSYMNTNTLASPTWTLGSAQRSATVAFAAVATNTSGTITLTDARVTSASKLQVTPENTNADGTGIVIAWIVSHTTGSAVIGYRNIAAGTMAQAWTGNIHIG